jgi:hypothetical protein
MLPVKGIEAGRKYLVLVPVSVSKHLLLVELVPVVWDNSLQPTFLLLSEWAMMLRPNEFIPPIHVTIVHEELHRFLDGGLGNVPSDVQITFFINFYICRIPTVIDENRIVF